MKNYWRAGCGKSRKSGSEGACWKSAYTGNSPAGYPTFQALNTHDPVLVAVTIALFLDLLHYRTVQWAVKTQAASWWLMAGFTTSLAFGLQWIFYSQPGADGVLPVWQRLLFASIVPVGLGIMAWHHQQRQVERVVDWQQQMVQAQAEAEAAQGQAAAAQSRLAGEQRRAEEMQEQAEAAQQRAADEQARAEAAQAQASHLQERVAAVQQRAEEMQQRAAGERRRADELYIRAEDAQLAAAAVQGRLTGEQRRAEEMQQRAEAAQQRAAGEQARADEVQGELTRVQQEADELRRRVADLEAEAAAGRNFQAEMGPVGRAWQALNDETQTLALYNARLLPVAEAAERLGVHESTVRRRAKRLNGQTAEVG